MILIFFVNLINYITFSILGVLESEANASKLVKPITKDTSLMSIQGNKIKTYNAFSMILCIFYYSYVNIFI